MLWNEPKGRGAKGEIFRAQGAKSSATVREAPSKAKLTSSRSSSSLPFAMALAESGRRVRMLAFQQGSRPEKLGLRGWAVSRLGGAWRELALIVGRAGPNRPSGTGPSDLGCRTSPKKGRRVRSCAALPSRRALATRNLAQPRSFLWPFLDPWIFGKVLLNIPEERPLLLSRGAQPHREAHHRMMRDRDHALWRRGDDDDDDGRVRRACSPAREVWMDPTAALSREAATRGREN